MNKDVYKTRQLIVFIYCVSFSHPATVFQ